MRDTSCCCEMRRYENGRTERVAAENHPPTCIWPPCPPEAAIGRGPLASTNGASALQGGPTQSPTSHQPPHLSLSLEAPSTSSASGPGGSGRRRVRSGRREGSGPQSGAGGSGEEAGDGSSGGAPTTITSYIPPSSHPVWRGRAERLVPQPLVGFCHLHASPPRILCCQSNRTGGLAGQSSR